MHQVHPRTRRKGENFLYASRAVPSSSTPVASRTTPISNSCKSDMYATGREPPLRKAEHARDARKVEDARDAQDPLERQRLKLFAFMAWVTVKTEFRPRVPPNTYVPICI